MSRRLQILLVAQPTTGGVAVCVRDLARAGTAAGMAVTVACPAGGDLSRWVEDLGARWVPLDLVRLPTPADLRRIVELRRLLQEVDLVHLHSSKAGALGRLALLFLSRRRRPASVFTPHGWSWLAGGRASFVYRLVEQLLAPVAKVIVCVSSEELELGRPVLGRDATRVRVVESGVDVHHFRPDGEAAPRADVPLVTCVARLAHQKGQDVAVAALARVGDARVRLRLVGDGPAHDDLVFAASALDVADRVELVGRVDDTAPELRAADVVVVPSRWDGLSLALLEAMACGAAVIATRIAGSRALDGVGVLIPPDDPAALAEAVEDLLGDPDRRAALGVAARARAEEEFGIDRPLRRTLALWRELAA